MTTASIELPLDLPISELARRYLMAVYEAKEGHVIRTAASLGITQATVYKWLRRGVPPDCRLRGGNDLPGDLKHLEQMNDGSMRTD